MDRSAAAGTRRAAWRWPGLCPVCAGWSHEAPCPACLARHAPARWRCPRCALPLASPAQTQCADCLRAPPPFARAVTAFDYAFPWDGLIAAWKFGGDVSLLPALLGPLQTALAPVCAQEGRPDLVLPMPLATDRLRERGFNQAWELARRLGPALGVPARADLLRRWRATPHQTGLDHAGRLANLRGAFMPAPEGRAALRGRHVALVDDVMTTGASAREASAALLEAGVARISLWLLARTPAAPPPA